MENEFPCDIESVISIKVNFENLKVFLEFLDKKNNKNQSQINDIYNKLKEVDVIKEDIKEMNNQIYMINSRQDEMNGTLNYHSSKILEFEKNYVAMDERIIHLENESIANKKKFSDIDQSIDNLNKVTEDNCNKIDKLGYFLNTLKSVVDGNCEKIESHAKSLAKIEEEIKKIDKIGKDLNDHKDKTKSKIKKLKMHNEEQRKTNKNFQTKITEIDEKIEKINEIINEVSIGFKLKSYENNTNIQEASYIPNELTEIKLRFDNFTKDYDQFKRNYKNQMNFNQDQESFPSEKKEKVKSGNSNNLKAEDIDKISDKLKEFEQEISNLKEKNAVIFYSIEEKIGKDDLERINKNNSMEIDKVLLRVNEMMNKVDNKLKGNNMGEGQMGSENNLIELVNILIKKEKFRQGCGKRNIF